MSQHKHAYVICTEAWGGVIAGVFESSDSTMHGVTPLTGVTDVRWSLYTYQNTRSIQVSRKSMRAGGTPLTGVADGVAPVNCTLYTFQNRVRQRSMEAHHCLRYLRFPAHVRIHVFDSQVIRQVTPLTGATDVGWSPYTYLYQREFHGSFWGWALQGVSR